MGKRTNNQLPNNLPQLQNCVKKDPDSYKDEVSQCENIKVKLMIFLIVHSTIQSLQSFASNIPI